MFLLEIAPSPHVVVGGAVFIACEFACILHGLGVPVTQLIRRRCTCCAASESGSPSLACKRG